jgi:hypothetical protein
MTARLPRSPSYSAGERTSSTHTSPRCWATHSGPISETPAYVRTRETTWCSAHMAGSAARESADVGTPLVPLQGFRYGWHMRAVPPQAGSN